MFSLLKSSARKPKHLGIWLEQNDDEIHYVYKPKQWGVAGFLLFWLTGWTFACMFLIWKVVTDPQPISFLFAVPFWASWFLVAAILCGLLFYREEFWLNQSGAKLKATILGCNWKDRTVPLEEIVSFEVLDVAFDSDNKSLQIVMTAVGQPLHLAGELDPSEQARLAQTLAKHHQKLRNPAGLESGQSIEQIHGGDQELIATENAKSLVLELRPPAETVVSAPSDTNWKRSDDFDSITFASRGRLSLVGIGLMLFLNLFWNGIVGVFVAQLFGVEFEKGQQAMKTGEWWPLFLFLIPFELVGAGLVLTLLAVIMEPARRSRWRLWRDSIEYRVTWFGIGPRWRYAISELDRLELRKTPELSTEPGKNKGLQFKVQRKGTDAEAYDYSLALIGSDGQDLCQINMLALGEACWFADAILRERPLWFVPYRPENL